MELLWIVHWESQKRDIPALLGLGVSYQVMDNLRFESNITYYVQEDADWGGDEKDVENGFDAGVALEYAFNDTLKGSVGYMRTETQIDVDDMLFEAPQLDADMFCGGLAYEPISNLTFNFGVSRVNYHGDTTSEGIGLDKEVMMTALGVQYKIR